MKIPLTPPPYGNLMQDLPGGRLSEIFELIFDGKVGSTQDGKYLHWDDLIHLSPPEGLTHEEWWICTKSVRGQNRLFVPLLDKSGRQFHYTRPDPVLKLLHHIDQQASGQIGVGEEILNPATRERYVQRSLIEEAITSSQMEGAATTREVAKEMLRTNRSPKDHSERMVRNNYEAIQFILERRDEPLTADLVIELQRILVKDTVREGDQAGRLRRAADDIAVRDPEGQILHMPPPAEELEARLSAMCRFANETPDNGFMYPVVRAIILHFWLAYDHPFVDGNGRTARALFYWAMLSAGYWLAEYISISNILKKAQAQYSKSFLYTETDDNDLTYFIHYHLKVIDRAIRELDAFLDHKRRQLGEMEQLFKQSSDWNHRQLALLSHALRHPGHVYTIRSHQNSHRIVRQTARTDLFGLADKGLLEFKKVGRTYTFLAPADLAERLATTA